MTRRQCLTLAAAAPFARAADASDVDRFFDGFLEQWVRANPETATNMRFFTGEEMDRLDGRLNDIGDEAAHARIARAREGLAGLRRFDRAKMTPEQRLSADLFAYQLSDIVSEEPFLAYTFPINQFIYAVQVQFPTFMTDIHPVRNRRDAENYLLRLQAGGPKIDSAVAMMRDRARRNFRLPAFIGAETVAQMQRFTAPGPAQNILVTSLAQRLKSVPSIDPAQQTALVASAEKIVRDTVYPAYRRAADGLATENAKATGDAGLWRLPGGPDAYAFFLRRYTTTNMTAEQIHQTGLAEVARMEAEMDVLLRKLGYTGGSVIERFAKLQAADVYPDSPDVRARVLADYEQILRQNNERSLEAFDRRPKAACIVKRIPQFQEANAAANYSRPPADGSRPGIFNVPLPGPKFSRPTMRTLAAHEAIPGHHFQLALQVEMTSLPRFRRQNPFGSLSAYTEGWGLYAERLASELGWYRDDAQSEIGRLSEDLFRARRLVVDTGLHTKRWTRAQGVAYGIEQSEVDRYVVLPGQACSYKIGQLKILELREESRKTRGARFSLKEFHNIVLGGGAVPLALLERTVRDREKA